MNSYLRKDFSFCDHYFIIAHKLKSCDQKKPPHHFTLTMSYKRKEI